jgi:hypothetical protein
MLQDALKDALKAAGTPQRKTITAGAKGMATKAEQTGGGAKDPLLHGTSEHNYKLDPGKGRGSALVANGTSHHGKVLDAYSLGSAYLGYKEEHPDWSEQHLLTMASREDLSDGGDVTSANAGAATRGKSGRKVAGIVANGDYFYGRADLPHAIPEATAMKGALSGEGYEVDYAENQDSAGIRSTLVGATRGAKPGDEVTLYFSGHGREQGMLGINGVDTCETVDWGINPETGKKHFPSYLFSSTDMVPYDVISALAGEAVSGGWHLTAIIDCCESGRVADVMELELQKHMRSDDDVSHTDHAIRPSEWRAKGIPRAGGRFPIKDTDQVVAKHVKDEKSRHYSDSQMKKMDKWGNR